jgi:hypothetical protein
MGDVMEAAEPAEVTNTGTAVVPYPVEAATEAVSATMMTAVSATMMTAVSATMTAAVTAASGCDGRRESNDRGSDGKGDGCFSKHRSVSSVSRPPGGDASAGG